MTENKTYTTELLPRRSEITAWVLAVAAWVGLVILAQRAPLPFWVWFFVIFLTLSAASISLGNWVDRKTVIQIDGGGVHFENGLRKTHLTWAEIQEVRTTPAQWGTAVQVIGTRSHFGFTTLGEMKVAGQVRGRTGFVEGLAIFDEIIQAAGLTKKTQTRQFLTYTRP